MAAVSCAQSSICCLSFGCAVTGSGYCLSRNSPQSPKRLEFNLATVISESRPKWHANFAVSPVDLNVGAAVMVPISALFRCRRGIDS